LLVEAGTGTGKSLGYLLPAALHAVEHGDPVVISTATIALQDQLIEKDIPALQRAARAAADLDANHPLAALRDVSASVLKGRANYLCLRRWFLAQREPVESAEQAQLYTKVTAWLHHTETGDRAELRLTPEQQQQWRRLAEEEGACLPNQCIFHRRNQCFLFRGRNQAEASHLIIVNHSLLLSDLFRGGSVMPPFRHLIIDEAHHLEEEATKQAGYSLSAGHIATLLRRALHQHEVLGAQGALGVVFTAMANLPERKQAAEQLQPRLSEADETISEAMRRVDAVFTTLGELVQRYDQDASGYERRVRIVDAIRVDPAWSQVEIEWDQAAAPLNRLMEILGTFMAALEPVGDSELPRKNELLTELQLLGEEVHNVRERGYETLSIGDEELICWLSRHQTTGEVSVNAAPLHVASLLEDRLYRRLESLTLTSATLTTEKSFSFIRERLGLPDADELQVPSPFDYRTATLFGIVNDVPEPGQQGHQKLLQHALIQICEASNGRAMLLFTSHNALQTAYHAIKRPLEREGILVLGQRVDGSPRQLIERLRERPRTVVLGTNSFWEGVDIVGDALSLLVITRLPFPVPSDPVFAARSELFEDPFTHYAVPQAILRFEQGFGRLIRSARDRGACIVLDRRIVTRRYGRAFIDSLPECTSEVGSTPSIAEAVRVWLSISDAALPT
jgi:DNA polymerase-3 subunit epsilon/ATP-dependent DNA helicase DinG